MQGQNPVLDTALRHIRYMSETIGGRGSCTNSETRAAEYLASEMEALGLQEVRLERFKGAPSTYRPYALAFITGLAGTLLVWLSMDRWAFAIAAILNAFAAWGMLAETDFRRNWMRLLLPKGDSQNAIGLIPPRYEVRQEVVLNAHFDTHRTPVFYSSRRWQMLFSILVGGAFASMVLSMLVYTLGAVTNWGWIRWVGLPAAAMETFALAMAIHADFTPFSPGANNGASGIGIIMALAERLVKESLSHTRVWLVFTGCEETAAYGILHFLQQHAEELGEEAIYIVNDLVGAGQLNINLTDGLIVRHKTHPAALTLARQAIDELPQVPIVETQGIAYTDATPATKLGRRAITLVANPPPGSNISTHWHQMSDTLENIDPGSLEDAFTFDWQLLQIIDRMAASSNHQHITVDVKDP